MSNNVPPGEPVWEPVWEPEDTVTVEKGTTEEVSADPDRPVAVLWLPDPEQRHGWREYYVKKEAPKPGMRPMGYRRK